MATEGITREEITLWSEEAAKSQRLQKPSVSINTIGNYHGYVGDIAFVTARGTADDGEEKELHLALKFGKKNRALRDVANVGDMYARESYVYETVLPLFAEFQERKGVEDKFDGVARCYKAFVHDGIEVLCLADLRAEGYSLHDNKTTMDDDHLGLILENYAKFHAVSFAMRDQEGDTFDEKFHDYNSVARRVLLNDQMLKICSSVVQKACETVRSLDTALADEFLTVYSKGADGELKEFFRNPPREVVVTHADSWNNNYMIKYEEGRPVKVAILDWQLSNLHSPVVDLAYFLYACASYEQLSRLQHWLRVYHDVLRKHIKAMGSDPDELFPYETLLEHWKAYGVYGVTMLLSWMDMMLCDKGDVISFNDMDEDALVKKLSDVRKTDVELYQRRIVEVARRYCEDRRGVSS